MMQVVRTLAALAVGTVAGEVLAAPVASLLSPHAGDYAGLATTIGLPFAVAGAGAVGWLLTRVPKQPRDALGRFKR